MGQKKKLVIWVPQNIGSALFQNQIVEIFTLLSQRHELDVSICRSKKDKIKYIIKLLMDADQHWIYSRFALDGLIIFFLKKVFRNKVKWWHDFRGVSHVEVSKGWKKKFKKSIDRCIFIKGDKITAVSDRMKTYLQETFQKNRTVKVLAGPGIGVDGIEYNFSKSVKIKKKINIIYSGGHDIQYENCPDRLVEICKHLSKIYHIHLHIIRKDIFRKSCNVFKKIEEFSRITFYNELQKEDYSLLLSKMDIAYVELKETASTPLRVVFCHPLRISDYLNYPIIIITNYRNKILEQLFWYQGLNSPYLLLDQKLEKRHRVKVKNPFSLNCYVDSVYNMLFS